MLAVVIVPLRLRVVWTPDMPPKRKGSRRNRYAPTASRLRHAAWGVKWRQAVGKKQQAGRRRCKGGRNKAKLLKAFPGPSHLAPSFKAP